MKTTSWLKMSDGEEIFVSTWSEEGISPKTILQLSHGMGEHIARYDAFAQYLVDQGIIVVGNDHRGHGETGSKSGQLGFFAAERGFERAVEDLKEINNSIKEQYPNTPIFIMGHSMGSFLVRRFLQRFQTGVDAVILSGTGGNPGFMGKIAKTIAKSQIRKLGQTSESQLMNKLIFGRYNKNIPNMKTSSDWLTRDHQEVQKYIEDKYCGFIPTTSFFYDLMEGLESIHKNDEVGKINKKLPFFIFSGDQDPVGNYSKGVVEVIKQYKNSGINNIEHKFYKEGRHEMLNELNRTEVYHDISTWIEKQLKTL
ncbi:alpha-beta hydrolase superfamily lysophospholipase [Metabacillus crassostreae]|uniref:alpha/beta hydrolase n=1 Tax=Metabacillus crassostreae TaxID=929098 RepID=UPI001958C780|nr:alpha/beta hydrolase [Metabacillus crassostreae]MBM7605906.1 alpha-beta hydrolase superfamily lysophospholipase [Metabacillus crassostreae]